MFSALVACGDEPGATSATEVTYLTSFSTFGRDAYAFVAQEKGFFTDAGFDVLGVMSIVLFHGFAFVERRLLPWAEAHRPG